MRYAAILLGMVLVAGCEAMGAGSGDVPTYRGDSARSGVMPGPGPSGQPSVVWEFRAAGPINSSPAVVGGTVFVVSGDGVVHALQLAGGAERWSAPLGAEAGAATPLVIAGNVVVGDRAGVVHALDPETGAERWATTTDGPIAGAAAMARNRVLTATESGSAYALDPSTGEVIWQATLPGGVTRSIAATEDLVYFAVSGGVLAVLRTSDGSIAWQAQVASDGDGGTPTVAGGLVYAATGLGSDDLDTRGIVALDAQTGEERWRHPSPQQEDMYAPAVIDGRAYIVAEDATVVAVDAATGAELWTATTGAPVDALPAVWGSVVYVATEGGSLQALDTANGRLQWQSPIVGGPYAPIVTGGFVLVGTNAGVLFAIGDATP